MKEQIRHEPLRQAAYLQQCLAQDKRPIGFLLAAGCPLAIQNKENTPLIPDIAGLTALIAKNAAQTEWAEAYGRVIENLTEDGADNLNIEKVLSYIRALRQVAGNGEVRGLRATDLDNLDQLVCREIVNVMDRELPNTATPYHQLAAWIKGIHRDDPVEIFTTNYDLLIEQALEESRIPYFDGFIGSRQAFFDTHAMEEEQLPPRWARLWKLHGSINWRQNTKGIVYRSTELGGESERFMIHPSHLKYDESRRMPYLAMVDRLRAFLKQPCAVLLTCGYSFGDEHLNSCLAEALQANPTGIVFGMAFGGICKYPAALDLSRRHANFSLLAKDQAVIGSKLGRWIEQDAQNISTDFHPAVSWRDTKTENRKAAEFLLGDFVQFGEFLAEVIGTEIQPFEK